MKRFLILSALLAMLCGCCNVEDIESNDNNTGSNANTNNNTSTDDNNNNNTNQDNTGDNISLKNKNYCAVDGIIVQKHRNSVFCK